MARRIALLIATDAYADDEFSDLRTPCTDAQALASLLSDPQIGAFDVTILQNRPAQEIRQVLDETFTDARRDDLVLLHVSGHGIKDEAGKLHFVMSDTRRRHLRASAIAAAWVRELVDHCAARRVVVWLDCCFSGAFPPGFTPKGTETVDAIDQLTGDSGRGCAVMTASTKIQYAFEQGQASVFTAAITAGLRTGAADLNEDGFVDVGELYSYVFDWVKARTPDQTPTRNDMLTGDVYIAYSPNGIRLPLELTAELRALLRSPDPRYRNIGVTELITLADAGDETARAALKAIGANPTPEQPPRPRPAADVDPPRAATFFTFAFSARAFSKFWRLLKDPGLTGMAFDPAEPSRVCVTGDSLIDYLDVTTGMRVDGPLRKASGDQVRAMTFSPDGRFLAIGTSNATTVWFTNSSLLALASRPGARAVAFSSDGTMFANAGPSEHTMFITPGPSDIQLWNVRLRKTLGTIPTAHSDWIDGIAFSPDGRLLASGGRDRVVKLWDLRTRRQTAELRGHEDYVRTVTFSPYGQLLATAGSDCTVRLWDVSSRRLIRTLKGHWQDVTSLAFSPDGQVLVSGSTDRTVRVWDPRGLQLISSLQDLPDRVVSVDFNPAGDKLACATRNGHVAFWQRD